MSKLRQAIENDNFHQLQLLLDMGHDVNEKDEDGNGNSLLHIAVTYSHYKYAELLIKYGADVNIKNGPGETPLFYAARDNNEYLIELLIKGGADINAKANGDRRSLLYAIEWNADKSTLLLYNKGAIVNSLDKNGLVLKRQIISNKRYKVFAALIDDPKAERIFNFNDIYKMLGYAFEDRAYGIVNMTLKKYCYNEQFKVYMNKLLFIGAMRKDKDMLETLLSFGANVNARNENGITPIYLLAGKSAKELVLLLISWGAKCKIANEYNITPFIEAVKNSVIDNVEILLLYGIDTAVEDWEGNTALKYAQKINNEKIVKLILESERPERLVKICRKENIDHLTQVKTQKIISILQSLKIIAHE